MRRLVLMTDYSADPIWDGESGAMLDLDRLPLTASTRARLREWARRWELQALAETENAEFDVEGRRLWAAARDELVAHGYLVGYAVDRPHADTVLVEWVPGGELERPPWMGLKGSD
jgi:hypothetical protein